ncbi:MAG: EAL domain-containing protein [Rhodospirillales bacterium]|nr:EAL domain-containing protein [Alphaproteobacteria bacterium]MCB9987069.1 EAL domain-containing protein [Rhodospirillales bacterium]USO08166.1 MAG: EAL domain-containing protein [Rhodospirillales bacterium]
MNPQTSDIKDQRDRFLAFAFAGADLMIEVDADGTVLYALGATKGMTGSADGTLTGRKLGDIFAPRDRGLVSTLCGRAKPGQRFGPVLVNLNDEHTSFRKAMLSGLSMPDRPGRVFLTLSKGTIAQVAESKAERASSEAALMDAESFAAAALDVIAASDTLGQSVGMTLVDMPQVGDFKNRIGAERWSTFRESVSIMLRSYAADGRTAGTMGDGRFGVVHGTNVTADAIRADIESLALDSDPENRGTAAEANEIDLDNDTLSERELAKALMYTINQFEKQGQGLTLNNLQKGFESFLESNAQKISEFKTIINQSRFDLKFQPIVDLATGEPAYYEALVRFDGNKSPYDSIVFCEDVGLSPELDLAICGKIINYLVFNSKGKKFKVSVNLSGVSIQNQRFIDKLRNKLEPHLKSDIPSRLIFEITESSQITDLDKVNTFVRALQDDGFKVSLDDFGAGAASFQYLHKIHVDSVKIDGQYITNILSSDRDRSMISNLVRMCADLDVSVVAERVETREQADALRAMNVALGQGYYFAKPLDEPDYQTKLRA